MPVEATCWCGRPGDGETLVVERPPRLVCKARCPDHGRVVRPDFALDEVVRLLESGASRTVVRWPSLAVATLGVGVVASGLPVPVLVVDLDAHAVFSNSAWARATGMSSLASRGQRWLSALRASETGTLIGAVSRDAPIEVVVSIGGSRPTTWMLLPQPLLGGRDRPVGHLVVLVDLATAYGSAWAASSQTMAAGEIASSDARHNVVASIEKALQREPDSLRTVAVAVVQVEELAQPEPSGRPGEPPAVRADPLLDPTARRSVEARIDEALPAGTAIFDLGHGCFAVVWEETTSYTDTLELAERLVAVASVPAPSGAGRRASVGVAFPHLPNETPEDVLANAGRAVDLARAQGGGRVEVVIGTGPGSSDAGV